MQDKKTVSIDSYFEEIKSIIPKGKILPLEQANSILSNLQENINQLKALGVKVGCTIDAGDLFTKMAI